MTFKYFIIWMYHNLFLSTPLCEHLSCSHFFLLLNIPVDTFLHTSLILVFHLMYFIKVREGKWGKCKVADCTFHRNYTGHLFILSDPNVPVLWDMKWCGRDLLVVGASCLASDSRNVPLAPHSATSQGAARGPGQVGLLCVSFSETGKSPAFTAKQQSARGIPPYSPTQVEGGKTLAGHSASQTATHSLTTGTH